MIGSSRPASAMMPKSRIAEDEHARHRGNLADSADDEGPGLRPEAAQERGGRRDRDQRCPAATSDA